MSELNTTGVRDLKTLLGTMQPVLHQDEMVFCFIPEEASRTLPVRPICVFREQEGVTLILPRRDAETAGLPFSFPCRMITLKVHSSLQAVGFLAVVAGVLAEHGISVNPISAYCHDHLFVPVDRADEAFLLLKELQVSSAVEV